MARASRQVPAQQRFLRPLGVRAQTASCGVCHRPGRFPGGEALARAGPPPARWGRGGQRAGGFPIPCTWPSRPGAETARPPQSKAIFQLLPGQLQAPEGAQAQRPRSVGAARPFPRPRERAISLMRPQAAARGLLQGAGRLHHQVVLVRGSAGAPHSSGALSPRRLPPGPARFLLKPQSVASSTLPSSMSSR